MIPIIDLKSPGIKRDLASRPKQTNSIVPKLLIKSSFLPKPIKMTDQPETNQEIRISRSFRLKISVSKN